MNNSLKDNALSENIPKLTTLYVYLTDYCNLNCRHCWINPQTQGPAKTMELGLLTDILEQAYSLGMRALKLTGGEPLLYDAFIGLLEYLKKKRWDLFLYMETNATLIDKRMAKALKEGGLKFVSLSIDGDNSATHDELRGVSGFFEKAWIAAKEIVSLNIPLQIITAVYRANFSQLEGIAKLAQNIGAESIKANFISPMGRGLEMAQNNELLSLEEILQLNKKIEGEYRKKFKLRFCSSLPIAFRSFDRLLNERINFCRIKGLLGILASGKVSICGIGQELKELILGDGRKDRIQDIWQKSPLLWNIRNQIPTQLRGVCKICIFKNRCLGHCVAQSYYSEKSFTSPFWVCQKAYERGLFPKTRLYPYV
jgi:SynChlorMet cassette radical SAM/SPASM protein ScmF